VELDFIEDKNGRKPMKLFDICKIETTVDEFTKYIFDFVEHVKGSSEAAFTKLAVRSLLKDMKTWNIQEEVEDISISFQLEKNDGDNIELVIVTNISVRGGMTGIMEMQPRLQLLAKAIWAKIEDRVQKM
jgi:hypothetical protein